MGKVELFKPNKTSLRVYQSAVKEVVFLTLDESIGYFNFICGVCGRRATVVEAWAEGNSNASRKAICFLLYCESCEGKGQMKIFPYIYVGE